MPLKKHTFSGFTLTEIMVTMGIFTLLVSAFYSGINNSFQKRNSIRSEINTIQNLFLNARNLAITSSAVNANDGVGGTKTIVSQYGYGIHIMLYQNAGKTIQKFTLFSDTNPQDTDSDGTIDTYGDGNFDNDDTIISEYSAFEKGVAKLTDTEITLIPNSGDEIDKKYIKKSGGDAQELTILFAPIDASPRIILNNDISDPSYSEFQGFEINFFASNIIEEKLKFNKISRFFERVKICPQTGANPEDCSTRSII